MLSGSSSTFKVTMTTEPELAFLQVQFPSSEGDVSVSIELILYGKVNAAE